MKLIQLSVLVLVMLLSVNDMTAQITSASLGSGTSSSATRGPFQRSDTASSSVYSRANLVYTQAEVANTLGISAGSTISQINWDLGSTNVITATGTATMNIYMKNSSAANAVGDTWANITSGATLVGTYTFDATNNNFPGVKAFLGFPLSTPFVYTGGSIEIAVDWDCSGLTTTSTNPVNANKLFSGNGSLNWRWDATTHTSLVYKAGSSSAPSDLTSGNIKSQRVNTQFVYTVGSGATTITSGALGMGTSSSATRGPFQRSDTASSSVYSRANLVYTQAEVATTLGIGAGSTISQIKWDLGSTNVITATGTATMNIYMKNSSAANAVGDTWANITNGATLVASYTFDASSNNFPGVKGFMAFPLSTPFVYTGGSIEIAVDWDCSGLTTTSTNPVNANKLFSGNGSLNWRWDATVHTSLIYRAGSSSAPTDLTPGNLKSQRVNTQFVYSPPSSGSDSVNITFLVNTANITVNPTGLYLGGGVIGGPTEHQLSDADGDGVYEVTITKAKGFGGNYIFLNGNSGWGAKENLTGLPCADPNNFDDRILAGVYSDTTLLTCYETCATDTICPPPSGYGDPDLPITFQDTATIDYALVDFGGDSSVIAADPTDPTNIVVESTKLAGAETWAGTVVADNGLVNPIPFTSTATTMSVRVWSPDANTPILLKVEDATNNTIASEVQVNTTTSGAWEVLVFDFANGSPALDLANTYDKVIIFFDFGAVGAGKTYYWDDVEFGGNVFTNNLIVDDNLFSVRPNVTKDFTNIHFADNVLMEEKTINVYNALGELVKTEVVNNINIYRLDVNGFSSGMYFINVQSENKTATKRLVIQK